MMIFHRKYKRHSASRLLALLLLGCTLLLTSCAGGSVNVVPAPVRPEQTPAGDYVPVERLQLNLSETVLTVGDSVLLVATVIPLNATDQTLTWQSSNEAVAKVNQRGRVTALSRGSAVITVETADGGFVAACSVQVKSTEHHTDEDSTVHVQSVSISQESLIMQVGEEVVLTSSVLPENAYNQNVQWINSNSRTILLEDDENGGKKVIAVGTGNAVVTVISEDGGKSATCQILVPAKLQKLSLSSDAVSMPSGGALQLTAIPEPADLPNLTLTYKSSNDAIVTVDKNGLVIAHSVGSATVTVTGDRLSASCVVTVESGGAGTLAALSVRQTSLTLTPGESMTMFVSRAPVSAEDAVTYTSANPSVAFVTADGIVTGNRAGETTVTVSAKDGAVRKSIPVIVEEEAVAHKIYLNRTEATLKIGETLALETGLSGQMEEGEEILFFTSDPAVAEVDKNGFVTTVGGGSVTISAVLSKSGYTAYCTVVVKSISVESVSLNSTSVRLQKGGTWQLRATVYPANASMTTVHFFSSDPSVASVTDDGLITAVRPGEAVITARSVDGRKTADCQVTVLS